jgi:alpha-L-fucosidase
MKTPFSRRKFLKTSALAGAAGLTAPLWLSRVRAADAPEELTSVLAPTNVANGSASADVWRRDTPELVAAALKDIPAAGPGPFEESWDSIGQNYKDPDWFRDGKFGIYMHWGIYSVPAHQSEWYVRYMYGGNKGIMDWHTEHFGPPTKFGYKDFLPMFTAAKWDSDAWADLFKKAGAKYVFAPGEHHDGFSNWDSKVNPFNAKNYGPHRDLDGDLITAVRKAGLKTGISDHSFFHFQFIPTPPPGSELLNSDLYDPKWKDFYTVADRSNQARVKFMHNWVARRIETIDKYNPDMLWFDMGTDHAIDPLKIRVAAYYYNRAREWGKEVAISAKGAAWVSGQIMDYEREGRAPMELTDWIWQPDDPIQDKFGYVEGIHPGPPGGYVVRIVENVSKNGNYLLNISPKADGTIPQEQQDVLLAIGQWLGVNGEAIYHTRPWTKFGEGPVADACAASMVKLRATGNFAGRLNGQNMSGDGVGGGGVSRAGYTPKDIRFTTRGDTLYAMVMKWPDDTSVTVTSLATSQPVKGKVGKVELLGHGGPLQFTQDAGGLKVKFPTEKPCDYIYALKITGLKLT